MNSHEIWHVNAGNYVYESSFEEVKENIEKGKISPRDMVKEGDLAWCAVEDIPELKRIFTNLQNFTNRTGAQIKATENKEIYTSFQAGEIDNLALDKEGPISEKCCALHPDQSPFYICSICENLFCQTCPAVSENNIKICGFCGGKCVLYLRQNQTSEIKKKEETSYDVNGHSHIEIQENKGIEVEFVNTKLDMADFLAALIYPFYFPFSLMIGGFLFSALIFGVIITAFMGEWNLLVSLALLTMLIMLKFGVLSKTIETFTQGDFKKSFLPELKKFTVWEDFVNPFFTGLGVYLVSFGLFFALTAGLGVYAWVSFSNEMEKAEIEMHKSGDQLNTVIKSVNSSNQIREVTHNELRTMINQSRMNQLESVFGKNHLVDDRQLENLIKSLMRLTILYQIPVYLAFLLGILYFPAVCLNLGDVNSVSKINFTIGFRAMKKFGFDYIKILLLSFTFLTVSIGVIKGLDWVFSKMELPIAGILTAIFVGSFLIFYFWTAFSGILGIAACKKTVS